jgi:hypothetical protein
LPSIESFIVINATTILIIIDPIAVIFGSDKMVLHQIVSCREVSEHNFYLNRVTPPFHPEKFGFMELYFSLFPSILLLIFALGLSPLDYWVASFFLLVPAFLILGTWY